MWKGTKLKQKQKRAIATLPRLVHNLDMFSTTSSLNISLLASLREQDELRFPSSASSLPEPFSKMAPRALREDKHLVHSLFERRWKAVDQVNLLHLFNFYNNFTLTMKSPAKPDEVCVAESG